MNTVVLMSRPTLYAASVFRNAIVRLQETHLATRLDRWMTGIVVVLLFSLGYITGRWTSLTNTATPIVFQEAPGESSEATPEQLRALVKEKEAVKGATESREAPKETKQPQAPKPKPQASVQTGAYVASANGTKYYHPDCAEVRRIKEENRIWFDSAEEAQASGYEPSVCVQKRGGKE